MTVVEANFLHNNVAEEMPDRGEEGGQLVATLIATPHRQRIDSYIVGWPNQKNVERYQFKSLFILLPAHLYIYIYIYTGMWMCKEGIH